MPASAAPGDPAPGVDVGAVSDFDLVGAIANAVTNPDTGTAPTVYVPPGIYLLDAPLEIEASGLHLIGARDDSSSKAADFVIDAQGLTQAVVVAADNVKISGVTIKNGASSNGAGAGILVKRNTKNFQLLDSSIEGNVARDGGGLAVASGATAVVQGSTFIGNGATKKGGGIRVDGTLGLVNSTLTGNTAQSGGALSVAGTAKVSYSTFVDNNSNNQKGGGVDLNGGTLEIRGSILTGATQVPSPDGSDCSGNPDLIGPNYVGTAQGCNPDIDVLIGTVDGVVPLEPLADNGGPTRTFAIPDGSILVDAIAPIVVSEAPACQLLPSPNLGDNITVDQRGVTRPADSDLDLDDVPGCDLGAYEVGAQSIEVVLSSDRDQVNVGAEFLPAESIGPSVLGTNELFAPPDGSLAASPLSAFPLESVPLSAFPLSAFPLSAFPLSAFPLSAFDTAAAPLSAFPLSAFPLSAFPLSAFSLSEVVLTEGSWDGIGGILEGSDLEGVPLQSLTLNDVLNEPTPDGDPVSKRAGDLDLRELNLDSTPLSAFPLSAFVLSAVPLSAFPLSAFPLSAFVNGEQSSDWCDLTALADFCLAGSVDPASPEYSLASLALAGVPLSAFPLSAFPLSAFPLSAFPLSAFNWAASPLSAFPLSAFPLSAFDCTAVDCANGTLGDAADQNAFAVETFGQLASALLGSCTSEFVSDCVPGFPADLTLADLIAGIIPPSEIPWEQIDLGLPGIATAGPASAGNVDYVFDYYVDFRLERAADQVTIELELPGGQSAPSGAFSYVPGASVLDGTVAPTSVRLSCPNAVEPVEVVDDASDCIGGPVLVTFELTGVSDGPHRLTVPSRAGFEIGTGFIASVTASVEDLSDHDPHPVEVVAPGESGSTTIAPVAGGASCVAFGGDVNLGWASLPESGRRFFDFVVPDTAAACGIQADIYLSNLPEDFDLVLYAEKGTPLRNEPTRELSYLDDVVFDLNPYDDVIQADTVEDVPQVLSGNLGVSPDNFAVTAISANRLDFDEHIKTGTLKPGRYFIQVSGYNGASSPVPFALRVRTDATATPPECSLPVASYPSPGQLPDRQTLDSTLPTDLNTLFLVNEQMLELHYGLDARQDVLAKLGVLANSRDLGVAGAIVPVDGDQDVRDAVDARFKALCDPTKSNDVVSAIGQVIDDYTAARPGIENIVIVGDDRQIPMANLVDNANFANERTFYQEFAGAANESTAALAAGMYRSDDPYGTEAGIQVRDHELFVPTRAVGRLVESPTEIIAALENFIDYGGRLDPDTTLDATEPDANPTAFQSGYEFLEDGALENAANLADGGYEVTTLLGETWDDGDLATALETRYDVTGIHGHFNERQALPAAQNYGAPTNNETLFDTGEIPDALDLSVVYSMGCHSGWSNSDVQITGAISPPDGYTRADDWAQALTGERGNVFAGSTGFGYGDTEVVALTERLTADYATELARGGSVGRAWVNSKQRMVSEILVLDAYQEKAVEQFVFYGLPMFHLGVGPTPIETNRVSSEGLQSLAALAAPVAVNELPGTGLYVAEVTTEAAIAGQGAGEFGVAEFNRHDSPSGSYYDVDGDTLTNIGHPIQPLYVEEVPGPQVVGATTYVARDALIKELTTINAPEGDQFDPVFFWGTSNYGGPTSTDVAGATASARPEYYDGSFPAEMASVRDLFVDGEERQQLLVSAGQFRASDEFADLGTQRLHTNAGVEVYYTDETDLDFVAPLILTSDGSVDTTELPFTVKFDVTTDDTAEYVYVLYRSADTGRWQGVELDPQGNGNWSGSDNFFGIAENVEYIVQARDQSGNVAMSNAKSRYFLVATPLSASTLSLVAFAQPVGTPSVPREEVACANGDWYNGDVPITVEAQYDEPPEAPDNYAAQYRVNSGTLYTDTFPTTPEFFVVGPEGSTGGFATDGVYMISALDETGAFDSCTLRIDTTDPDPVIHPRGSDPGAPIWLSDPVAVTISATDTTSGVASLEYRIVGPGTVEDGSGEVYDEPIPLTLDGQYDVSATAIDVAGNTATETESIFIDRTPPTVTVTGVAPTTLDQEVAISVLCVDVTSLVASCDLTVVAPSGETVDLVLDEGGSLTTYTARFSADQVGTYLVSVDAQDNAGLSVSAPQNPDESFPLEVTDVVAPDVVFAIAPRSPNGSGWYNEVVSVEITATDNVGVASLDYSIATTGGEAIPGGRAEPYAPVTASLTEGVHVVSATATDTSDNLDADATPEIKVDLTPPTATLSLSQTSLRVGESTLATFSCSDDLSRVDECVLMAPTGATVVGNEISFSDSGSFVVEARAVDFAGNAYTATVSVEVVNVVCVTELYDETQAKNIGTNYTITIELCGDEGSIPTSQLELFAFAITDDNGNVYPAGVNDSGSSNGGDLFLFRNARKQAFVYNLNTTDFAGSPDPSGTMYNLEFTVTRAGQLLGIGSAPFALSP